MSLLKVQGLSRFFGGLAAVNNLEFDIEQGEILGLIGPNGAGKTTCFNLLSGVYTPSAGKITFAGEDVTGKRPYETSKKGMARTFQATTLFGELPVLANLLVACHANSQIGFFGTLFNTRATKDRYNRIVAKSMGILDFVGLAKYAGEVAMNLPYGHQKKIGIAIALATDPKLLMLDEPATGMNPEESLEMMKLIGRIRDTGVTVLLVEHDMKVVMGLCDRIVVMSYGSKIAEGTPQEIASNHEVIEAYLGVDEDVA